MVAEILLLVLGAMAQSPCLEALEEDLLSLKNAFEEKEGGDFTPLIRFWYTGKDINDLGHYQSCVDRDDSEYFILKVKDSDYPAVLGVCAPKGCTADEVSTFFNKPERSGVTLSAVENTIEAIAPGVFDLEVGGWLTIIMILVLSALVLCGSFISFRSTKAKDESAMQLQEFTTTEAIEAPLNTDIMTQHERDQPLSHKLLSSFSVVSSYQQLGKNNGPKSIHPLNGVKVFAFGWMLLGQLYVMRLHGITFDLEDIEDFAAGPATAIGYGATTAINTIFWLTGFLAGYGMLNMLEQKGRIDWKMAILTRVFRLLPVMAFCMAFNIFILPTIGFGPQWNDVTTDFTDTCSTYWWTNLIVLNNFVPNLEGNLCYFSTWAVAVNLQLFILAPFLVLLYIHKAKIFTIVAALTSLTALALTATVAGVWEVDVNYMDSDRLFDLALLNKPYFHYLPFLTGLYLSVIFYMYKQGETNSDPVARILLRTYTKNSKASVISFVAGLLELNTNIFTQLFFYSGSPARGANVFYLTHAQFSDSLSLTLILLPILLSGLPKIARVLSFEIWGPLARLSFCAYMMHEGVMRAIIKGEQTGFYWTHMSLFNDLMFNIVVSYLAAVPVFFLVEGPCYSLLSKVSSRSASK
mmetsp:Transcript_26326/g.47209  ORF Transcript_26326/g.47209 Transcript_26326/m.47209 type:complete len:636 (-) Transcript_26326:32-1939(-)|eukprot:CAMPEP_0204905722 /NCGR_PEP_ID=MMETSP1397-20131031/5575_1 /ASSEMBLY_ACC=CAM_ASM_000891 /TAXON_ID=49980 /ORGANISM="Climacostomum Climacostomum virens, Strain Stock W-24" /LENGTH=635 /DNA_ID=CAMNT_0052074635 /DNA_START=1916 /DNA_END=3823 /DNA_ORIENTATION=-